MEENPHRHRQPESDDFLRTSGGVIKLKYLLMQHNQE